MYQNTLVAPTVLTRASFHSYMLLIIVRATDPISERLVLFLHPLNPFLIGCKGGIISIS